MKHIITTVLLTVIVLSVNAQNSPKKDTLQAKPKTFYLIADETFFNRLVWALRNPSKVSNVDAEIITDAILTNTKPVQKDPSKK